MRRAHQRRILIAAMAIEVLGIAVVGVGIGYEVEYGAHWGLVAITVGSMLVAAGGIVWGKWARLLMTRGDDHGS